MNINNILFVSPMYQEAMTLIEKDKLQKNFRFLSEKEMSVDDLKWADALICFNLQSNIDYSKVKWVHSLGAGVDKFLYGREWNDEVLLTRTICSFGQRIAEYCLSYVLKDLQFHMSFEDSKLRSDWRKMTPRLLSEQRVMIFGTGEIGQKVAEIFSMLGMEVYGVSLSGKEKEFFKEVISVNSYFSRLKEMDFIINTLPLTEQTFGLFY